MAVMEQLGPTDVAAAFVKDGKLVVIDARVQAWTYEGGKKKDAGGDLVPAPESVEHAFVASERLTVVDGSGMCWTYLPASSSWAQGHKIDDKAEPEAEGDDVEWTKGVTVEGSEVKADELRRAKATLDAQKADEEEASTPKSKKRAKEDA